MELVEVQHLGTLISVNLQPKQSKLENSNDKI